MAALNIKPISVGGGGGSSNLLSNLPSTAEKNKQWQRELLMERIRSHSSQHKTFQELSKGMRMGMLEKRYPLDAVEKANLQKCLDNMQHCIKVTSRQGLVERLESLSRQLSLKFSDDTKALFISTDMFYLEILLDSNGSLTDVKVHHESKVEQQSCSELVDCLNRGDFADFTAQLEGFSSIYQLNAESKVKIKAYDAMLAMETDLYNIFQMQNFSNDAAQVLQDSAVGIVMQRRGGHPMRLVYFVSPYDLISLETKTLQPITLDTFTNKQIGFSVTVNLEASSANKLQILPTVTVGKDPQTGMDMPVFSPLTQSNSMLLPATFVLRLNKPLPVCYNTLRSMGLSAAASNDSKVLPTSSSLEPQNKPPIIGNIMSLIIQTASEQQNKSSQKGLFVCLPDQTHCYFFTENKLMKSALIHSVPFTEPSQVRKILEFLKKMALFYSLLASCVRPQTKMGIDMESTTVLEVNAISIQQISVALQHPYEESMATVEFDLRSGVPQCSIYSMSNNYDLLSIKLTNIVQKCLSIPVTIRALLKFWEEERMKMFQRSLGVTATTGSGPNASSGGSGSGGGGGVMGGSYGNFNISGGSNDPGGGMSRMVGGLTGGVGIKMETNAGGGQQRVQASQLSSGPAGYLKYKSEIKQEDFHESPKSQQTTTSALTVDSMTASNLMQSNLEVNSLGHQHPQQQQQIEQQIADHEIADKYKNIWKDKTATLKNTVSITPINAESSSSTPLDVKRTGGIEIIPLTGQANNPGTNASNAQQSPINNSGSTTITITPINAGSSSSSSSMVNANKEKKSSTNSMGTTATSSSSSMSSSSSSSSSGNKRSLECTDGQKDKKRKKKRDDSPMGPPEKIFSRQNSPAGSSEAAATAVARKFSSPSSSPNRSSGGLLTSSVTGSSLSARPSPKHSPVYSSPKHNTASNSPKSPFGTHSPKHGSSGKPSMSTLKSATAASPKGDKSSACSSSVSSSSVLNSAALVRSLAGSGSASTSTATASTVAAAAAAAAAAMAALKNKDKTSSMSSAAVSTAAAAAAAAVKSSMGVTSMQQMKAVPGQNHMSAAAVAAAAAASSFGGATNSSNSSLDLNSAMRKGVAAAVSLMTSTPTTATVSKSPALHQPPPQPTQVVGAVQQDRAKEPRQQPPQPISLPGISEEVGGGQKVKASGNPQTLNTSTSSSSSSGSSTNSEYMVKTSQEGLKLTINKTSTSTTTKVSSSSSSSSSKFSIKSTQRSGSPSTHGSAMGSNKKAHTGLKPGVNSGPASKKSSSSAAVTQSRSSSSKHVFQKSNSSGSLSTKLGSSTNSSSSGFGLSKSHSTNSFGDYRRSSKKSHSASTSPALPTPYVSASSSSQPASRLDHQADMLKILQYASPTMAASMEGFMKGLNSKFQIPKLSQRNNAANTTASLATTTTTATTTAVASAAGATGNVGLQSTNKGNTATTTVYSPPVTTTASHAIKSSDNKSFTSSYGLSAQQQQQQHHNIKSSSVSVHNLKPPPIISSSNPTFGSGASTLLATSAASLSASNTKSVSLNFQNTTKSTKDLTHVGVNDGAFLPTSNTISTHHPPVKDK